MVILGGKARFENGSDRMKIATGIIALGLMVIIGIQSIIVGAGGAIMGNKGYSQGGSAGVLVAFLFLIAGAFSFKKPIVSAIVFICAAIVGFAIGGTTGFSDMNIWGSVSLILGIMSLFTWRGERKKRASKIDAIN